MRAVIQRVLRASVSVQGRTVGEIGPGIAVLLGIHHTDSAGDCEYIINKLAGLRIFDDADGVMNMSLEETGGEILVVSQFTLYGDARKGRRPSYSEAMPPERAEPFYNEFMDTLKKRNQRVSSGIFGADMKLSLVNSGPVTILLDSKKAF
ncbi:MAG TPA: D-aminoacyl-tRNA deacylase [Spirochaetota bacterium]|nr:D-aminoacyl-tRNA deacylase [Spirochaetota bacterium]HRZ25218.1 D-aminoacyl-tRNA deacylase [Spirochaetota bacterium]HSA14369.1 D-aminoacyl-tRNA deacylase [Spirochaetota bacterium]